MRILKEKRKERGSANDFGGINNPPGFNRDSFCEPSIAPGFNRGIREIGGIQKWKFFRIFFNTEWVKTHSY
jgi:hypothetical protein